MIRQEIDVNVSDVTMTGEITVSSPVIAITSQEETYDLTERKNFSIKLKDTDGVIVLEDGSSYINVDFEFGGKNYNANMSIYNRSINGDVTLQYASGLTAEDISDDSSDEPETHTLEFDNSNYDTSYDINTGEKSQARFNVLYDGTSIHLDSSMFSGLVYNKIEPIEHAGGIFKAKDALHEVSAGQTYTDDVTVTYEGMTASCVVMLTVTDSGAEPDYTTKIKCTTSEGEFLVYSTDANDTIQTVQYNDYTDIGGEYRIPCSWSVETNNPEYQNLTDFQSDGGYPFNSDHILSESLNGTVTGQFGGGDYVEIVESLSIQIEYVAPE